MPKLACRGILLLVATVLTSGASPGQVSEPGTADGRTASVNGLQVSVSALRSVIGSREAPVFLVELTNVGEKDFRLPSSVTPAPPVILWTLTARDTQTGKVLTGISRSLSGGPPVPVAYEAELLPAGQSTVVLAAFANFVYADGELSREEARTLYFNYRRAQSFRFPAGTFDVSATITFATYPVPPPGASGPQAAELLRAREAWLNDPVPFWRGGSVRSNEVRITVIDDRVPVTKDERLVITKAAAASFTRYLLAFAADDAHASLLARPGLRSLIVAAEDAARAVASAGADDADLKARADALHAAVSAARRRASEIRGYANVTDADRAAALTLAVALSGVTASLEAIQ